jgi:DNA polymerase-3 subunit alpha
MEEYASVTRLFTEREYIGAFLSGHPLDKYNAFAKGLRFNPDFYSKGYKGRTDHLRLKPAAIIDFSKAKTRKGNPMYFITIDTGEEVMEVPCFNYAYDRYGDWLQPQQLSVLILKEGRGQYKGSYSIEAAYPLRRAQKEWPSVLHAEMKEGASLSSFNKKLVEAPEGNAQVWVSKDEDTYALQKSVSPTPQVISSFSSFANITLI